MHFRHVTNYRYSQWLLVLLIQWQFPSFFGLILSIEFFFFLTKPHCWPYDIVIFWLSSFVVLLTHVQQKLEETYTYIVKSRLGGYVFCGDMIQKYSWLDLLRLVLSILSMKDKKRTEANFFNSVNSE